MKKIGTLHYNFFEKMAIFISKIKFNFYCNFFVCVYLKQKVYFNTPNNLEDLRQRIRFEMERKALTLLSAVYKVSVSAKWLAGNNFNICVKLYWLFVFV
jgi:hypothetical protein